MRKFISLLLVLFVCSMLASCGDNEDDTAANILETSQTESSEERNEESETFGEAQNLEGGGDTEQAADSDMDYQLMLNGFLPVSIAKENRLEYYNVLEEYAVNGDLEKFSEMIAALEEEQLDIYIALINR